MSFDQTLPPPLAALSQIEFEYGEEDGIDWEPYDEFFPASENSDWIRAWTGNQELDGAEYRIFGQDGTGGYGALWLVREGADLLEQPVVFFGSEGEIGIIAQSVGDFMWLFAAGYGPLEAVEYGPESDSDRGAEQPEVLAIAKEFFPDHEKTPFAIVSAAKAEFPDFEKNFMALCGH